MDICITIPKSTKWSDYERELAAVKNRDQSMLYRVAFRPRVNRGDRCWVCWNGEVIGWMTITDILYSNGFNCTTTGRAWPPGLYIERSGSFHYLKNRPKMQGFRGIRYIDFLKRDEWDNN